MTSGSRMPTRVITRSLGLWLALAPLSPQTVVAQVVERVIDGDTLVVQTVGTVRLIGVDTPETVHPRRAVEPFGPEATRFTRTLAEGRTVRLEYEGERHDRYGRTLGYVYLDDGTFLNAEIVKRGYGRAYMRYSFKFRGRFRAYERQARMSKRGLWRQAAVEDPAARAAPAVESSKPSVERLTCGAARACVEISSCAEAEFYLRSCGVKHLDGDADGIPCEALCR
jgi:endonuclease YncB( thermonuclease family)